MALAVFLGSVAWWAALLVTQGAVGAVAAKRWLIYLSTPGWFVGGTAALFFAMLFSGLKRPRENLAQLFLWGEPLVGLALVVTNGLHGWMWQWAAYTGLHSPWLGFTPHVMLFVHVIYTSAIVLIGAYLLFQQGARLSHESGRSVILPLGGILLLVGNAASWVALWDEGWQGICILFFSMSGLFLTRALIDSRTAGAPLMGEMVFDDRSPAGWLRVTADGVIRQVNQSAAGFFQVPPAELLGRPVSEWLGEFPLAPTPADVPHEVLVERGGQQRRIAVRVELLDSETLPADWSLWLLDVTDTWRARQALQASEQRYAALLAQSTDAVLLLDGKGRVHMANPAAARLFGLSQQALSGKPVAELHPPVPGSAEGVADAAALETQRPDGTALYLEVRQAALADGMLETIRDVSNRVMTQKAEEEARAISAELRSQGEAQSTGLDVPGMLGIILDHMSGLVPYDVANVFLIEGHTARSVHARGFEAYGSEVAGQAEQLVFDLGTTPTLRGIVESRATSVIADTAQADVWKKGILVDNLRSWIGAPILQGERVIAVFSLASQCLGAYDPQLAMRLSYFANQASLALENAALFEETRRRVRELEQLSQLNRDLAEMRDLPTLAQRLAGYLVTAFDARDVFLWVGGEQGSSDTSYHLVDGEVHIPEAADPAAWLAHHVGEVQSSVLFRNQAEWSAYLHAEGHPVSNLAPEACMGVPLSAADGWKGALLAQDFRRTGWFGEDQLALFKTAAMPTAAAISNIRLFANAQQRAAELAEANQKAQTALSQAEDASQAKTRFLATMSHEIRTPLNGIIGMTSMLMQNGMDADQQAIIEIIRTSAETLSTLINDILDLSKIESGRLELEHHPFHLHECMESALEMQVPRAMERGLDLAYLIEPGTPDSIAGDSTRLRQVMVNLLNNGIKFTEQGGVFLKVWEDPIPHEPDHAQLHFSVSDTGIGISAEKMDGLFQAFNQLDASTTRKYGGTGLGLAISKQLCELMGGTAWAESQGVEGIGTTFHFTIQVDVDRRPSDQVTPVAALKGKRILLACAAPFTRSVLVRYADAWGMTINTATNEDVYLEWLEKESRPDLLIIDDQFTLSPAGQRRLQTYPFMLLATPQGRIAPLDGPHKVGLAVYKPVKPERLKEALLSVFTGQKAHPAPATAAQVLLDQNMATEYPLRILLAEDNLVNQKVALLMLTRLGYQADLANNGLEAVQMVKDRVAAGRGAYDVVLMDVHMPVMNGEEATHRIRTELPVQFQPYIIALTADALDANRERFLAGGMDAYISKPIHVEDLMNALVGHQPSVVTVDPPQPRMPEPEGAERAVINQEAIDRWMKVMGSGPIFAGILGIYLSDSASLLHEIEVALKEKDWKRLMQAAHTLKSSSANFGAQPLADQLATLELATCGPGEPTVSEEALAGMVAQVRKLYPEAAHRLSDLQAELIHQSQEEEEAPEVHSEAQPVESHEATDQPRGNTAPLGND